ncbi:MAG: VCBS repeat-containing protein [Anaerolineales bacterium]
MIELQRVLVELGQGFIEEMEIMPSENTTPSKAHSTILIGSLVILGLVVLGLFLFYGWLVTIDSSGTFHNVTDVADLDGDGDLDVVMHNVRNESEFTAFSVLTLWFNLGDGQFNAQRLGDEHFGVGYGPGWASAAGDVDLDGNVDLVIFPGWQVSLLYNQGGQSGEFGKTRGVNNLGGNSQFGSIALDDLNGDGRVDGVIAGCCGRQFTIDPERSVPNVSWTWINAFDGNGYPWFKTSPIPALEGLAMRDIALGDLNGDTYPDLFAAVLASGHGQNTDPYDRVFYNDGEGNFSDSGQRLGGSNSTAVALGDMDGDSDLDAMVGTETQALLWVNQGSHEGRFALAGQTLPGNKIRDVFLSDFDLDGDLDAIVAGIRGATIWWNDGQGMLTKSSQRFRYTKRHGVAVGDFNADNRPDIFIAEYYKTYTLWLNQGDGTFRAEH